LNRKCHQHQPQEAAGHKQCGSDLLGRISTKANPYQRQTDNDTQKQTANDSEK
jgi:hypothetical protein